jgi:uncharacterized repeat protein (TIGR01451 family)
MERMPLSTRSAHKTMRLIGLAAAAVTLMATGRAMAVEGPVIFGGDNFARGQFNPGTLALEDGWLAMQREIAFVSPKVGRTNDNTVAAIGAHSSGAISADAGAAIGRAVASIGLTTTYVDGADAINAFFADLRSGVAQPRVLWIAGNSADNVLDTAEIAALSSDVNAATMAMFVNGGGGIIAHGDENVYAGWLPLVAPGVTATTGPGIGLTLTPAGATALPGVTPASISVGPWRSSFTGNLGNLDTLVTSTTLFEADGVTPRKVVIGGGRAWTTLAPADLSVATTAPKSIDRGDIITYSIRIANNGPNLAAGTVLTHTLPRKVAFRGATGGPGRPCTAGPPVTCTLGNLPPGATAHVVVLAKVLTTRPSTSESTVSSHVPDGSAADNTASRTIRARTTTLRVKVAVPPYDHAGNLMRMRITVRNTGRRTAKGVVLRTHAPGGFALERRAPGSRSEGQTSIWELGNIRPGRSRTVIFRLRMTGTALGKLCVPAQASAANADQRRGRDCLNVYAKHGPGPVAHHTHVGLGLNAPR